MQDGRFAGVDWASEEHAVCVNDEHGRIVEGRRYGHDERGIRALVARLLQLGVELVAVERPDGLLIERLLDAGLCVIAVHPNQVCAMRPRFTAAGGKSDSFDAFVLAELARTDSHRFRVLKPDSDETEALRALTRGREDLVRARPGARQPVARAAGVLLARGDQGVHRDRLPDRAGVPECYPSPVDARGLGEQRLAAFLRRHGYSGGRKPRELLARLRGAAQGRAGELEIQARRQIVLGLVAALKPLGEQITQLRVEIRQAPVAVESGKSKRARQRGCTHQHATRILGRAWCQIIWHDHDTYDPARHTGRQRFIAKAA